MSYPKLTLLPGQDRRLRAGHPWVFSNELQMDAAAAKALAPGDVVCLATADGRPLALAQFNPHSLIAARVLTRNKDAVVDAKFLQRRLVRALHLREKLFDRPYYRLVHAEADGLPGLVVDRFADVLVCQLNSAGMARLEEPLLEALQKVLRPRAVVLRNDSPVRELEGLDVEVRMARGELEGQIELVENELTFLADPLGGQKTGWYFDQRDNRAFAARLGRGGRVLDLYSYSGGFGLAAAVAGASQVLAIDRSQAGLDLALASAERNGLAGALTAERQDAFTALERLTGDKERFDLVVADPPSFVKSKRDLKPGLRGYRKLARACGTLVAEAGFLVIACCSHNVAPDAFVDEVHRGLRDAGRGARLLRLAGAGPDHPGHPALPESAYLKCLFCALD
jgi:23S rRNA (cytosine1962-C5)-methyltransferase